MSGAMKIPFLDLVTPHHELRDELTQVFHKVIDTAGFIGGPMVQQFEEAFAAFCGAKYCVGLNSGTDALRFALMAAGLESGDVVVTVPNTFIATTEAISQAGGVPEFVDVDEQTYNMDPQKLREYLEQGCEQRGGKLYSKRSGRRVAAIMPVHLYGQMCDMDPICELAEKFGLMLFEDACQAHGAKYFSKKQNKWLQAGTVGIASGFSFYPGKNLGACGDSGAATTNDEAIASRMRLLRDHGSAKKYYHDIEGYNGRLDSLQAGIMSVKLPHLTRWTEQRRENASRYKTLMADVDGVTAPFEPEWSEAVYHLFVVRVADRDRLMKELGEQGIGTGIHYPVPLHMQKAYEHLGYKVGDFPVSERVAPEIVSLPMFPQMTREQVEQVVTAVRSITSEIVLSAKAGSR
jgi:dTDP-4-amino-4,6-dideoxygalactose transaminase